MKNDIIHNIRLEMKAPRVRTSFSVRVGDTCTITLHITLASGGSVVSLENALAAQILINKPDGNICYNDCVICGNEIQYTLTTQSINVEGECRLQVSVTFEDEAIVTSPEFFCEVYQPIVNMNLVKSQNEYTALPQMVARAKQYADNAESSAKEAANLAEDVQEGAEAAESSAQAAQTAAEEAAGSLLAVQTAANSAEESARLAEESATESAASLTEAKEASQTAVDSSKTATDAAAAAGESASLAEESANNAAAYANSAKKAETGAETSAETAEGAADNAASSAEEAQRALAELLLAGHLTLGNDHNTAFYGDFGQKAYEHSQTRGNPHETTYTDVGAEKEGTAQEYYENATAYADQKIAELINGAPETLDTLKKIADAMTENADVVEALNAAIGKKAEQAELDTHQNNNTIHITANERTRWNGYGERLETLETLVQVIGYPYSPQE